MLKVEEIKLKFDIIHNSKYDYELVVYDSYKIPVIIMCPIHGEFSQYISNHLKGFGCSQCSGLQKMTTEKFISKSRKIHDDVYTYNKSLYKNTRTNIIITCPIHGDFNQVPYSHISGKGCHKCSVIRISESKRKKSTKLISEFNKVHNNKYDYLNIKKKYMNNKSKIDIICPSHGVFTQTSNSHLNGSGCPLCYNNSIGENIISKYLLDNNIKYIKEKTFDGCSYKRKLRFDFYLPEYNICIEYDGKQHYESIDYFGGNKAFNGVKKRDTIKNEYCINNNITLIRIPFYENILNFLKTYTSKYLKF